MSKGRAFSLLSGGLDSLLATRLIMDQGLEVQFGGEVGNLSGRWRVNPAKDDHISSLRF